MCLCIVQKINLGNIWYLVVLSCFIYRIVLSPGWCGSLGWVLSRKLKGLWFDSHTGHMPGLPMGSPVVGVGEATN